MKQIKKFRVFSVAKVVGIIYAAMGLLIAPLFLIFAAASIGLSDRAGSVAGMVGGLVMVVVAPIAYGTMGFLFGAVAAWMYNLISDKIGGIEVLLEDAPGLRSPDVVRA